MWYIFAKIINIRLIDILDSDNCVANFLTVSIVKWVKHKDNVFYFKRGCMTTNGFFDI